MGVGTICVSKLNYRSSGTVTPAQVFAERSETVNCAVSTSRLGWHTPTRPASHLLTYLHSTGPSWPHYVSMSASVFMFRAWCLTTTDLLWPCSDLCGNKIILRTEEHNRWTESARVLPWSFRCDATQDLVPPWEGFWSSASWSNGQPETGSSSCGWRCLWSGAWKHRRPPMSHLW